ncbi:MAG: lipopolysaccharide assembly protein LapA domain-containing protein [Aeromicrobium erythreum]
MSEQTPTDRSAADPASPAAPTSARPDAPTQPDPAAPAAPTHGFDSRGKVRTTRAGAWWTALVVMAIVSIAFLVFIAQNAEAVTIRFLTFEGELSLAVALLLSAALGALVVAIPGIVRMIQLRRALTRNAKER